MARTHWLAALLLVGAAASPAAAQRRDDDEYASRIDTTFNFDRRGAVVLVLSAGYIDVTSWDRPQIRVRARSERSVVRMDATPTRLSLDILRARGGDTRFEVTVPTGVRVSARASTGDISIVGTKGSVEARTQSGDLTVSDVAETIDLNTYSGDIIARSLNGNVEVTTLSGEVDVTDARGDVDVTSVSGDIDLRNIAARFVRAKTTSGDVSYDGGVDATGRYDLGSHSGSVYVTIPQNVGALFTIATYSGTLDSEFPITLRPGEHGIGTSKRFTFEVGKGDARITAESFSGDITIRTRERRPPPDR
jgi:DUF4097 and DUF4098 domain-containing protein YvlB